MMGMKLSGLRVEVLQDAAATGLRDAVNDWIKTNAGERTFVNIQFEFDGATYTALIAYTD